MTTPRNLRHFPVKDKDGNVDLPHVADALARIPDSGVPDEKKAELKEAAQSMLDDAEGAKKSAMKGEARRRRLAQRSRRSGLPEGRGDAAAHGVRLRRDPGKDRDERRRDAVARGGISAHGSTRRSSSWRAARSSSRATVAASGDDSIAKCYERQSAARYSGVGRCRGALLAESLPKTAAWANPLLALHSAGANVVAKAKAAKEGTTGAPLQRAGGCHGSRD